uniref:DNA polymerase n=1 Tax=Termitomyces titanicus TaxID=201775 RepID=A0A8F1D5J0_TERTA|nr:DNA polymerase [Termitomyces titanicus]
MNKFLITLLRVYFSQIRGISNWNRHNHENDFKKMLLPKNVKNSEMMDKVKPSLMVEKNLTSLRLRKDENMNKRLNVLRKGFLGYEKVLKIDYYESNKNELLLSEVKELINQLEKGMFYSLLINASTVDNNFLSVLPYSIFLCYKSSHVLLANIIKHHIIMFEAKYEQPLNYSLVFLMRVWYNKSDIEEMVNENRKKILLGKNEINDETVSAKENSVSLSLNNSNMGSGSQKEKMDLIKYNKISISEEVDNFIENLSNILDDDLKNKNDKLVDERDSKKGWVNIIKNLKRRSIQFRLNPYIIENKLPVISGDFSYCLYSLEAFKFMFVKDELLRMDKSENEGYYTLLELYRGDSVDYTIFYNEKDSSGEKNGEGVEFLQWIDYFSKDKNYVTRCFEGNKVVFKYVSQYEAMNDSSLILKKRRNIVDSLELGFNFPTIREQARAKEFDNKFGVIDLETFKINEEDGTQCAYAGGWAVSDFMYTDYISSDEGNVEIEYGEELNKKDSFPLKNIVEDKSVEIETEGSTKEEKINKLKIKSYYLIRNLIDSILKSKYAGCVGSKKGYTFFAHNLSNFDFFLILSALSFGDEFELKTIFKRDTNSLVSVKISKIITEIETRKVRNEDGDVISTKEYVVAKKKYITLLDSNLIIPGKLRTLVKEFECAESKGYFPYNFVNINNLDYKGDVPSYNFFKDDMSKQEYINVFKCNELGKSIKDENTGISSCVGEEEELEGKNIYDLKLECIKYLKSDLLSLLQLIDNYSKIVYNEFGVNITEKITASSATLYNYLANFYISSKMDIKLIKGSVEKDIRNAYFGGLVFCRNGYKFKGKGYIYDVNSHYPSAMLNSMPIGNPILSNSKNLNSYFGFVYAQIIPPKDLDVYFIPKRNKDGRIGMPNTPFTGIYFSELLKESQKYGYQINVLWGYKFKKGEGVFNSFVETLYNKRLDAKKNNKKSLQRIYKLFLNSLYGRFGMKNFDSLLVVVDEKKANEILKSKNILFVAKLNDKYILRYNNNVNKDIIKFINKNKKSNTLIDSVKQVGITSNVAIAAAITGWGLIRLSKVLNIKGNEVLYSDTDSVFLIKKLEESFISETELGKFKLENVMTEGVFVSPKFYGFKTEDGKVIMKTKGVGKGKISYEDLLDLCNGKEKTVTNTVFRKSLKKGTISIIESNYTIKGVNKNCNCDVD